ncbi:31408_t:CDS:2, partial [Gigaspora margarita]
TLAVLHLLALRTFGSFLPDQTKYECQEQVMDVKAIPIKNDALLVRSGRKIIASIKLEMTAIAAKGVEHKVSMPYQKLAEVNSTNKAYKRIKNKIMKMKNGVISIKFVEFENPPKLNSKIGMIKSVNETSNDKDGLRYKLEMITTWVDSANKSVYREVTTVINNEEIIYKIATSMTANDGKSIIKGTNYGIIGIGCIGSNWKKEDFMNEFTLTTSTEWNDFSNCCKNGSGGVISVRNNNIKGYSNNASICDHEFADDGKVDEIIADEYQNDEAIVLMEVPLNMVMKMETMMEGLLKTLRRWKKFKET